MEKRIKVLIPKKGDVTIEVEGVKGNACKDLTASLEAALGGKQTLSEDKPEIYEEVESQNLNQY